MNTKSWPKPLFSVQRGAATLLMTTVLLMAISVIGIFSVRTSVVEQRVAANTVWSKQSADAAQSVLDNIATFTPAKLKTLAGSATTFIFTNDTATTTAQKNDAVITVPTGMTYTAIVTSADAFKSTDMDVTVTAANGVTTQKLFQRTTFGPYIRELPMSALTARSDATIPAAGLTSCTTRKSQTTHTATCPKNGAMMARTNNGGNMHASVSILTLPVGGGSVFATLSPDAFEANYFSDLATHLTETAPHFVNCPSICGNSNVSGKTGFIWVNGDLTLDGIVLGNAGSKAVTALDYGTDSIPVLLVVTGKLTLKNNAVVNGLIYTRGDWNNGANAGTVNGAVIVNGNGDGTGNAGALTNQPGDFTSTGNLILNYEFNILQNVLDLGGYVRVAGTWRDF